MKNWFFGAEYTGEEKCANEEESKRNSFVFLFFSAIIIKIKLLIHALLFLRILSLFVFWMIHKIKYNNLMKKNRFTHRRQATREKKKKCQNLVLYSVSRVGAEKCSIFMTLICIIQY